MKQQDHIVLMPNSNATPERSLLASVVLLAVNDACSVPPKPDKDNHKNKKTPAGFRISRDAFTAMRFFFDTRVSGVDAYAEWLDFDLDSFRNRLRTIMSNNGPTHIHGFDPMQRRNFRYNYGMWLKVREMDSTEDEPEESDDEQ